MGLISREQVSLRGIVMTILTLAVAGLAIATLRYQPSPPADGAPLPASTATVPVVAPEPPLEPSVTTPAPPPVVAPTSTPPTSTPPTTPRQTYTPTQTPSATYTPIPSQTSTPTATTSPTETSTTTSEQPAFPIRPSRTPSTLLPNGGRRS